MKVVLSGLMVASLLVLGGCRQCEDGHTETQWLPVYDVNLKMTQLRPQPVFVCDRWAPEGETPEGRK